MAKTAEKKSKFSKEQYLKWYESMLLMRKFEEKTGQVYVQQKIKGFCHLYIGQEAIVAGTVSATKKEDKHITAYRCHAHGIGLGMHPKYIMAEMYAKITGCCKGKGGSMHIFSKEHNFVGGHGIVGGQIPLGAGIAFADKFMGNDNVCVCSMGDGAVRQGALHEAFNMAMTWKLPVIFIVENNMYAMGTSVKRTSNVHDLFKIGAAFDMPSESVDGMNPESVHEAFQRAADHIRSGKGPYYLEIKTYRYRGHSVSDPAKYRTKEELDNYKEKDPVLVIQEKIVNQKIATQAEVDEIIEAINNEIELAMEFAENSSYPLPSELYEDNYTQKDYPYITD